MAININIPPINLSNYNKSLKWKEEMPSQEIVVMSDEEIVEMFDYTPINMKELSTLCGKSVEELKALLISDYYSRLK